MVFTKGHIEKIVEKIVSHMDGNVRVKKVLLFGSYARGTATDRSDIDLAFVSDDFEGMNEVQRMSLLLDFVHLVELPEPKDIEPFGFTPEELTSPEKFSLSEEVKKHGIVVYW